MSSKAKTILVLIFLSFMLALQLLAGTHGPRERSIRLPNNVTLKYIERGDVDATPIIFLHGYTDSWRSFENIISIFPRNFHVIAISQRGHGNSDRPDSYRFDELAGDLALFITAKKLGPSVIVGHSLGGLIAQQFAVDYPGLTKAVVIESSAPSFADNAGVPEFLADAIKLTDPVDRKFGEAFQTSTITKPVAPEFVNLYVDETSKLPAKVWKGVAQSILRADYATDLKKIKVPVLILWGDQDTFCPRSDQEQLAQGLDFSRLIIYEGYGHALHWENPSRFVGDVSEFMKSSVR